MYFNRSYGNFGMLALPLGFAGFLAGLYTAGYTAWRLSSYVVSKVFMIWQTHVPVSLSLPHHQPQWLYVIDTSMLSFLIVFTLSMTLVAIYLGQRIADTKLSVVSFVSYFLLYGFVAPFWLARAGWDTVLSKERGWLT
jgi:hypothetical protein